MGGMNGFIRIRDYKTGMFVPIKSFSLSDKIRTVKVMNESLMVSGEELIHFFEWDGTSYSFVMTLDYGQTGLKKIGISDDFKKLVYGGKSQTVNIRERNSNGTYDLLLSEDIGNDIEAAIVDVSGIYYIFSSKDNKIRIYYDCPA